MLVQLDQHCSFILTLNTGVPQGCVMSPFLYFLFTHYCRPLHGSNTIIKYADDTTVIGLIKDNNESDFKDKVDHLAMWCDANKLLLNTKKRQNKSLRTSGGEVTHTLPSKSTVWQWSMCLTSNSWGPTGQQTTPTWLRRLTSATSF